MMYRMAFAAAVVCAVSAPALAQSYQGGQIPAPASLAAQLALPACGFAATAFRQTSVRCPRRWLPAAHTWTDSCSTALA